MTKSVSQVNPAGKNLEWFESTHSRSFVCRVVEGNRESKFTEEMMQQQCSCSERAWSTHQRNLSSSSATLPRKSQETLPGVKKSALKSASSRSNAATPKKTVTTIDSRRFSTLPRSRARSRPNVATIFNETSQKHRPQRRQSEAIPWHQQPAKCTCRSSCYFCDLNIPKLPLSASTNAVGYFYPYSTLSLNQPNHYSNHQSQVNLAQPAYPPSYPQFPTEHHHSMINLNHNYAPPSAIINPEPIVTESPAMSDSPVPAPPAPPLNPSCARCRFTSSVSAATSNGTLHRQPSNPHLHQNTQTSYGPPPTVASSYTGEFFRQLYEEEDYRGRLTVKIARQSFT